MVSLVLRTSIGRAAFGAAAAALKNSVYGIFLDILRPLTPTSRFVSRKKLDELSPENLALDKYISLFPHTAFNSKRLISLTISIQPQC